MPKRGERQLNAAFKFLEILDRIEEGPICTEKQWDMKVLPRIVREKVKAYGISYDSEEVIPSDNGLADNVFKAGFDVAIEAGVLCTSTETRIIFTEYELKELLQSCKGRIQIGRGRDVERWGSRKPEDNQRVGTHIGPIGVPVTEDLFLPICHSYLSEDIIDLFDPPVLSEFLGRTPRAGTPSEAIIAQQGTILTRQACHNANRPGLCVGGVSLATTSLGHIFSANPKSGLFPTDFHFAAFLPELKTNWDLLNIIAYAHTTGGLIFGYMHPMIGGYVGGPAEAAVTLVASNILLKAVYNATVNGNFTHDIHIQSNSTHGTIWSQSIGHQAVSENTRLIHGAGSGPTAGCCTPMLLYEAATGAICSAVSGDSFSMGVRPAKGLLLNNCSGLEGRLFGKILRNYPQTKLKRTDANEIILALIKKYEPQLKNPPTGKPFPECYTRKIKPKPIWLDIYKTVSQELADLGADFNLI